MTPFEISLIGLLITLFLMAQGMPIGFVFAMVGCAGIIFLRGFDSGLSILGSVPYTWAGTNSLIPLPLFILMGSFAFHSGITKDFYMAAHRWIGRLPGGIALATMVAAAGFATCSGSSLAGAATMSTMAFPEMERYRYSQELSTGCIAAGGTLSIMIPPSTGFIIYGFLTETSIAKLFIAGLIPGIILSAAFFIGILTMCKLRPELGPRGQAFGWAERFISLKGIWGVISLFLFIIGGMYVGLFTPSEAGSFGAAGAFLICLFRKKLTLAAFLGATKDTLKATCFVMTIMIGAMVFNTFLTVSGFGTNFSDFVNGLPFSRSWILVSILLAYIPLGMFLDTVAMLFLTLPIYFPVIQSLGFDAVWFGVLVTFMCEYALITPPMGMNAFIVKGMTNVDLKIIFKGLMPFMVIMLVVLAILVLFPQLSLYLPERI